MNSIGNPKVLMVSRGGNPALDMVYGGMRALDIEVVEYPSVGVDYRYGQGLNLSASGYPQQEPVSVDKVLKLCKENYFDLLITDIFKKDANNQIATIITSCHKSKLAVIDQSGVNHLLNWESLPYCGRVPDIRFVRTIPREEAIEKQDVLLMSTRRNWGGPKYINYDNLYFSVFLGCIYRGFHDSYYRRLLVHDTFEDYLGTYFSRNMQFYGEKYYETIAKSLTAVSVKGMVWDSWRFWEILQVGSCLITEDMTNIVQFYPPFIHGKHYLTFRFVFDYEHGSIEHVAQQLKMLLDFATGNKNEIKQIGKCGHEFAMEYHSSINRAQQVLKILE